MCLKPKEPWLMPKETGEIGAKILRPEIVHKLVGDEVFNQFPEVDFGISIQRKGNRAINRSFQSLSASSNA